MTPGLHRRDRNDPPPDAPDEGSPGADGDGTDGGRVAVFLGLLADRRDDDEEGRP